MSDKALPRGLEFAPIPDRVRIALENAENDEFRDRLRKRLEQFATVAAPSANTDGEREQVGDTELVHRFVDAPGDSETVRWHLVEAGRADGEPIVFLHGLPDSWFMWHHQIERFAPSHRVLAVDLKGYGQSDKQTGDYRAAGVAEQLIALLDVVGVNECNVVTHDRGTVIADHVGALVADRVLRYVRGEQHLWHFSPELAPQQLLFTDPARSQILSNPHLLVVSAYELLAAGPIADDDMARTIQEWSHDQIGWAVPRYFNSSSFRQEWIDRRTRLVERWDFPVLVLQGALDPRQPREFYEGIEVHLPDGRVQFIDAGHFFVLEKPAETSEAIAAFLAA